MSRRHSAEKREILPDAKYRRHACVTKFMNNLMHDGKKSVAEGIVYGALERVESSCEARPVEVFHEALDNVKPSVEVRSRRVGGATYQVPVEVRPERREALAIRWLIKAAAQAQREHHGRASGRRAARRRQHPRHRREEARRHPQDGRRQQGVQPLPLVTARSGQYRWPANIRSTATATSGSWRTSTPARPRRRSGSSSTPASRHKIGEVHDGAATMDWMEQEQERGITITSAATTTFWERTEDGMTPRRRSTASTSSTPPATSTSPSKSSVRCACSTARCACSTRNAGVEPQTETVWRQADRYKVPRIVFVNKMDKIGADFFNCVRMIKDRTGATPCPIAAADRRGGQARRPSSTSSPWKSGSGRARIWAPPGPVSRSATSCRTQADEMRATMIELAVEQDDAAMEAYLEGDEPDVDTLRALIRKGTLAMKFVPVICGSAFKNKGVQPMLNAVIDYPADPARRAAPTWASRRATRRRPATSPARPMTRSPSPALAFKIMNDPFVGSLTFTRIYSGTLKKGDQMLNSTKEQARARRPHDDDARDQPRRDRRGLRRRHHRAGGPEGHHDRRHAVRSGEAGGPRDHDLPGAGDRDRGRAEDQDRPGKDGHRPCSGWPPKTRPSASRPTSRAARPS